MKKLLSIVLAAVLLCSVSVTALAGGLNEENNVGSITVSYGVSESYVVTIPANIAISTTGVESTLSASSVLIPDGKTLTVTATSQNSYNLEYTNSKIPYTVLVNGTKQTEATFTALSVVSGSTSGNATLVFKTTDEDIAKATKSGDHTDVLTFNCTIN